MQHIHYSPLLMAFLLFFCLLPGNAQTGSIKQTASSQKGSKVQVYYFHFTHRCATCMAVEKESEKAIAGLYGATVKFKAYNLDETEGQKMGEKLQISGQTLLIVYGNKRINLTNEGFMYARSNPGKLKEILKEKIDPLLQ